MKWIIVDELYLDYLRNNYEPRIPKTDYGEDKFKPFFGILFEKDGLYYITQVSHAQPRHVKLKNSLDFYKVYTSVNKQEKLTAVVNLNYMFPIPKGLVADLKYSEIEKQRSFLTAEEKSKYISLLRSEIAQINKMGLENKSLKLYDLRINKPEHVISRRCFDFTRLEAAAKEYHK